MNNTPAQPQSNLEKLAILVGDGGLADFDRARAVMAAFQSGEIQAPRTLISDGESIEVLRPHVPYGPEGIPEALADADYLDHAANNIAGGYMVGGSNVKATVIKLLHDTATALRQAHSLRE